jgi:YgiT-type zinc finger domain-containing protein
MCSSCKHATLIIGRSSLLLERGNQKTTVFNVPCLTCINCNTSSFDDAILRQYQSSPGYKVTILRTDEAMATLG